MWGEDLRGHGALDVRAPPSLRHGALVALLDGASPATWKECLRASGCSFSPAHQDDALEDMRWCISSARAGHARNRGVSLLSFPSFRPSQRMPTLHDSTFRLAGEPASARSAGPAPLS